jgi:hypothetical protein
VFDRLVCMNGGKPREELLEHPDPEIAMWLEHSPERAAHAAALRRHAGRHFAGRHFAGRHFAGRHFAGRHFAGRHFAGRHFAGAALRRRGSMSRAPTGMPPAMPVAVW